VNKADRGRTCRACHEVHAAKQKHQLRDGVPYGSKGWVLKLNYAKTANGGSCEKTCHESRSYTNVVVALSAKSTVSEAKAAAPEAKSAAPEAKQSIPETKPAAADPKSAAPEAKK
jgi:hypothetical protein